MADLDELVEVEVAEWPEGGRRRRSEIDITNEPDSPSVPVPRRRTNPRRNPRRQRSQRQSPPSSRRSDRSVLGGGHNHDVIDLGGDDDGPAQLDGIAMGQEGRVGNHNAIIGPPALPTREGFTRDCGGDLAMVCPACNGGLDHDPAQETSRPPTKMKTRSGGRGGRGGGGGEHYLWVVKACGHVSVVRPALVQHMSEYVG